MYYRMVCRDCKSEWESKVRHRYFLCPKCKEERSKEPIPEVPAIEGWAELQGSEKQIKYAQIIRYKKYQSLSKRSNDPEYKGYCETINNALVSERSAVWWIDRR